MTAVVFTQEIHIPFSDTLSYRSPLAVMTSRDGESDQDFYARVRVEEAKLAKAEMPARFGMPAYKRYSGIEWDTVEHLDVSEVTPSPSSP